MSGPWGAMNPNSAHQEWARWVYVVTTRTTRSHAETVSALAPALRRAFGSAAQLSVDVVIFAASAVWTLQVIAEHSAMHETGRVTERHRAVLAALSEHWRDATVQVSAPRLLAGARPDDAPREQLIVAPRIYDDALLDVAR